LQLERRKPPDYTAAQNCCGAGVPATQIADGAVCGRLHMALAEERMQTVGCVVSQDTEYDLT
jgi:hypothetical protein